MNLADKRCVPCRGGVPPLSKFEIDPLITQLVGWNIVDNKKLTKSYKFKNFVEAMKFANAITPLAEEEGHHPDLLVAYGKVTVYLRTHKIDGLTESDFYMAAKIDRISAKD